MNDSTPKSPQTQAVEALRAAAREHKRLSSHHRRKSRELMSQAQRLEDNEPEATSHGRPNPQT